ncbi:MAG: glycosyltransferase [Actinomycetota bacterium]|nr:glycosyltransferase [Actinomycetota bacterium]
MTLPGSGDEGGHDGRMPLLYLAPWVDFGGSDTGTIDWFRWLDRDRFAPSLITTQPSENRRLAEIHPYAEEVWSLPECMAGHQFPQFIFDFIHTRRIQVLHIMNSRLGFELLPDLGCLERPPAVVVQLHVEEPDRSGYVRYVTTRYGNLVDAFSVSSQHLATAMGAYDVSRPRIRVIPTGVDAAGEFNPERVRLREADREPATFRILFAGRLAAQKDPLLMVEVVRRVVAERDQVRLDIVGEGPFATDIRKLSSAYGLTRHLILHGPTTELAPWLAGSDLLLMTSMFEGVPYVAYEAMAMGVPVVAPSLPGTVELMEPAGGILVDPRDDVEAYVEAILSMIDDEPARRALADRGRARMLSDFSLRQMAEGHERLYDDLLMNAPAVAPTEPVTVPGRLCFADRPARGTPLVSIITPCFNHGRYLSSLFDSVMAQDYPELELIIVDDGSSDPDTLVVLSELGREEKVRVFHQAKNRGPSAARNRGIAEAHGRYILPVDSDNLLIPGAVRSLVDQLQAAGEQVGFIYPAAQYFGNRDYHFQPPEYNLHRLLQGNFIDTCSLLDREIFDAGLKFAEEIELGHEDWDLALALGARGVIGEPSLRTVMRYRKHGFTRSDKVEYLRLPFREEIQSRHPELFGSARDIGAFGRYVGAGLRVKARWSPALTVIASEPVDFQTDHGAVLLRSLERQTCGDIELVAECRQAPLSDAAVVRRIPPGLAENPAQRVQEAIEVSRGRFMLITRAPQELLADPAIVEKLMRGFVSNPELQVVAFTALATEVGRFPSALIERLDPALEAHSLVWRRELTVPLGRVVDVFENQVIEPLARFMHRHLSAVQWRHAPAGLAPAAPGRGRVGLDLGRAAPLTARAKALEAEKQDRFTAEPAIPTMPPGRVQRWGGWQDWAPPETLPLARHVEAGGTRRIITNDRRSPPGWLNEINLGSIQRFSPPGTRRLIGRRDGSYLTVPRGSPQPDDEQPFGYLEEAPLPLFLGIERALLQDGTETLVIADRRDPLREKAKELTFLGYIESFPVEPQQQPPRTPRPEQPVLLRWVDRERRRNTYSVLTPPQHSGGARPIAAELGRLLPKPEPNATAVYVDAAGGLSTDSYRFERAVPTPRELARWAAAPLNWHGFGSLQGRLRSAARRGTDVEALLREIAIKRARAVLPVGSATGRPADADPGGASAPVGYLLREPEPGMVALYAARHPVMADQFLTHHALEATDMGYIDVRLLGYLEGAAPVTGKLGSHRVAIPWASRFGLAARFGWDA